MRKVFIAFGILTVISCARVSLRTQEPIKVDINMRIDIYQHVVEDVESIEGQVYDKEAGESNLILTSGLAYAADSSPEVDAAIERRRKKTGKINGYFGKGYIGENREAHLEIIGRGLSSELKREIEGVVKEENEDREIIYRAVAKKRGADVSEVRKVFLEDHYKRAPAGFWFELYNKEKGKYIWVKK